MAQTIHVLRGLVTGDVSKFERVMRKGIGVTKELASAWTNAGKSIASSAARITTAVTAVGAVATRTFAKFEETMVRVGGVTRTLGTRDFKILENAAKQAGETTRFSANQSASAMEALGLAGLNTREIIASLPGALQLASAAQIDIATAANVAAKTMRAFGSDASELGRINDTLVATFTRANTDLLQLAEALKPVGPVAKAAGVSLEDTTAILAKMADAGFQGSLGGTALRNALINLAKPSATAEKILRALAIDAAEPLYDRLRKVEAAINGAANESEKLAIAAELFGTRGGPAMLAVFESGIDSVQAFADETRQLAGIARQLEQASINTLAGQFDILKSSIEGVVLTAGGELNPTLRRMIDDLQKFIAANRPEIVQQFAGALKQAAEIGMNFARFLQESGPAILEVSQAFADWLGVLLRFLAQHPRLVAMLALLKASSLLGITQAVTALGSALLLTSGHMLSLVYASRGLLTINLVGSLRSFITYMSLQGIPTLLAYTLRLKEMAVASGVAAGALKAGLFIALATAMYKAADAMGFLGKRADGLAESQERLNKTTEEGIRLRKEQADADLKAAEGDVRKLEAVAKQRAKESRRADAAAVAALQDLNRLQQRGKLDQIDRDASALIGKPQDEKAAEAEVQRLNEAANAASALMDESRKALEEARANAAAQRSAFEAAQGGRPGGPAPGDFAPIGDGAAGEVAEKAKEGLTAEQKARIAAGTATDADRVALQKAIDAARMAYDQGRVDEKVQGIIDRESGVAAERQREEAAAAKKAREEQANSAGLDFTRTVRGIVDAGNLSADAARPLLDRMLELANAFKAGEINAGQFAIETNALTQEMHKAVAAEERKRQQELLQTKLRLLQGRGTAEDKTFLMQQIQAAREAFLTSQINQQFEAMINNLLGVNGGLQDFTQRAASFVESVPQILGGDGASAGGIGGNAPSVGEATGILNGFLNSTGGRIQTVLNQIQLAQQQLNRVSDPGAGSFSSFGFGATGYRAQRAAQDQLRDLFSELNSLLFTPPPIFDRIAGENVFTDPGLQTPIVNQNKLEFPNLTRLTNADIRQIADHLEREQARRGRRA